ncbi:hypothetical protein LLS1_26080 [Leifsonia sp. LS1]|nr:hypothetical protein LLS1_26080 [Leifsonia sp. LS1]
MVPQRRRAGRGRAAATRKRDGVLRRSASSVVETDADALAGAAEALAVLLDAGVAPTSAWRHVGRAGAPPSVRRVAARIEAGAAVEDALAEESLAEQSASVRRTMRGSARGRSRDSPQGRGSSRGLPDPWASSEAAVRAPTTGAGPPGEASVSGGPLATLAAAWAVAVAAGAPLSPALRGAADALRDRAEVARDVEVALSGPRATARLVSWLPLAGAASAMLLGVDIVGALGSGPVGGMLLTAGAALGIAGRRWTASLVRRAAPSGDVPGTTEELTAIALSSGLSVERSRRLVAETCDRLDLPGGSDAAIDDILELAARAGAPAAELLSSSAVQRRRTARAAGRTAAARLGVQLLMPLAVCVLPSFLLLGVAPVMLALISSTVAGF